MLFNSLEFLVFFPVVTLLYFLLPKKVSWVLLLCASLYFYMCWKAKYILLIGFSIVVTYLGGVLIEKLHQRKTRPCNKAAGWVLAAVLLSNLAVLFLFKYYNFFVENLMLITQNQVVLPLLRFALPVGISFYTFQALGYSIDVYRGTIPAEKNLLRYTLFITFFPQLVAGPIERASNLLPQINAPAKPFDYDEARRGLLLMGWGFFTKLVIADRLALFVDKVYNDIANADGAYIALATLLFAIQIYCDFASYSNIARGAAQVLGFRLMKNFDCPYSAKSMSEFWQRWHISLSKWFEDYIYEPVVWSLGSSVKTAYLGIFLVFFVSGFWHGAAWTYVVWGLLHAFFRIFGAATRKSRRKLYKKLGVNLKGKLYNTMRVVTTFLLVDFTYIFFRAGSLSDALQAIRRMVLNSHFTALLPDNFFAMVLDRPDTVAALIGMAILFWVDKTSQKTDLREAVLQLSLPKRWGIYLALIFSVVIFGIYGPLYDSAAFIYFQF